MDRGYSNGLAANSVTEIFNYYKSKYIYPMNKTFPTLDLKRIWLFMLALSIVLQLIVTPLYAQKKQNVYFFKNDGRQVDLKDSADFTRIIQEPDSGDTHFLFFEFYANNKRKTTAKVSRFEPVLVYEGTVTRFNQRGKRIEITNYENGTPVGRSYRYFDNGTLHKELEYLKQENNSSGGVLSLADITRKTPIFKLIFLADSLGNEQVKEGNGYAKISEDIGKSKQFEEGTYADGFKQGVWKGTEANQTTFIETYDKGVLIDGESTKEGIRYAYKSFGEPPSFKGGITKFYSYLGNAIRYPTEALRQGIKGSVALEFTVERDGKTSEVTIKKSVHPTLDDEAKRVILASPKWIPATMRGVPVRVRYSVPLNFRIP